MSPPSPWWRWRLAPSRWSSLLQPGRRPQLLEGADWTILLLVALLGFWFRWDLRDAAPYIAETWHFYAAANLWDSHVPNVLDHENRPFLDLTWFFWQRPFLALPFHPFAEHSFAAYRAAHIGVTTTVAPLAVWLLRSLGIRRAAASIAGVLLAIHPAFLPWGVLMLPDSTVLALCLAALLAAHHGRPALTAVLLWAASWVKEIAFVPALALLVLALWRDADGQRARAWPPRLGPFARWLWPVVPLAFLPLWVSLQVDGARFPGFRPGGDVHDVLEWTLFLVWLAPVTLLGLLRERTRRFTLVALAWPAFFAVYLLGRDKAMEQWYVVLPAAFTLLAGVAALDAWHALGRAATRRAALAVAVALGCIVWVQVTVPDGDARNQALVTPFSGKGHWDLEQVAGFERVRDAGLMELVAIPDGAEREAWIAVDFEVSFLFYPLPQQADRVYPVWTSQDPANESILQGWQWAVEEAADVTILVALDHNPGNVATRQAYAECSTTRWPFVLIRARDCQGAGDDLWPRYQEAAGLAGASPS